MRGWSLNVFAASMLLYQGAAGLDRTLWSPAFVVPDFRDLTVETRQTFGTQPSTARTQTLRLKGARQRLEHRVEGLPIGRVIADQATIFQCELRQTVTLNQTDKIYFSHSFDTRSEQLYRLRTAPQAEPTGADVEITTDAVDTGERRQIGSYWARHVKTTRTVRPGPGANMRAQTDEQDGWYIALAGLWCLDAEPAGTFLAGEVISPGKAPDRIHANERGTAARGYPVEETVRHTEGGRNTSTKLELVELSERPLDAAEFEVPPAYRRALPTPRGGYDLTKPDTVSNRLQSYWDEIALWTRWILR